MSAEGTQFQKDNNNSFGLPKATFKPIEPSSSNSWLKITALIAVIVLFLSLGVIYWLFRHSSSFSNSFMTHSLKNGQSQDIQDALDNDLQSLEDITDGFSHTPASDLNQPNNLKSPTEQGSILEINALQGYYYVIIGSYIDKDLAMDYAKKLIKQGHDLVLIAPGQGKYFFRLAIAQAPSLQEARAKEEALKAEYGNKLWVLKY